MNDLFASEGDCYAKEKGSQMAFVVYYDFADVQLDTKRNVIST
jgi:hypothetical protein